MSKLDTSVDMSELEALKKEKEQEKAKDLKGKVSKKAEVSEDTTEPEGLEDLENPTDPYRSDILKMLAKQGITEADLDDARQSFGKVFCFPWNENKVYIFRPLFRKEWNAIKEVAQDQEHLNFLIIKQGCLHPRFVSIVELQEDIAGIQDTLSEVIMRSSGFIALEEAMATVREL